MPVANYLAARDWRFRRAERSGKFHVEYWTMGDRKIRVWYYTDSERLYKVEELR